MQWGVCMSFASVGFSCFCTNEFCFSAAKGRSLVWLSFVQIMFAMYRAQLLSFSLNFMQQILCCKAISLPSLVGSFSVALALCSRLGSGVHGNKLSFSRVYWGTGPVVGCMRECRYKLVAKHVLSSIYSFIDFPIYFHLCHHLLGCRARQTHQYYWLVPFKRCSVYCLQ